VKIGYADLGQYAAQMAAPPGSMRIRSLDPQESKKISRCVLF
jgi:hypothetical protein